MEIACDENFIQNEKIVTKDIKLIDNKLNESDLSIKQEKEMLGTIIQESINEEQPELADAVKSLETAVEANKDGGTSSANKQFVSEIIVNEGCDDEDVITDCNADNKTEVSKGDTGNKTANANKSSDILVPTPIDSDDELGKEEGDLEEVEKSLKSSDILVPTTIDSDDEVGEEDDDDLEEAEQLLKRKTQDEGEASSFVEEEIHEEDDEIVESKSIEDDIEEHDDQDDYDDDEGDIADEDVEHEHEDASDEDNDIDDVAVVLGSSEEEDDNINDSQDRTDLLTSTDNDDDDDDYDDDDLMNDVILSAQKLENSKQRAVKIETQEKKINCPIKRKKLGGFRSKWDWRAKLKCRSLKWLNSRMHSTEPVTEVAYEYQSHQTSTQIESPISSTTQKVIVHQEIIDIEDSPEKANLPLSTNINTTKPPIEISSISTKSPTITDMQQVDKVRDSIQNVEEVKQKQQNVKAIQDEQNKENLENNDIILTNSLKLNGDNTSNAINENEKHENNNDEKNIKIELMEISTENDNENSTLLQEETLTEDIFQKNNTQNNNKNDNDGMPSNPDIIEKNSNSNNATNLITKEAVPIELNDVPENLNDKGVKNNIKSTQPNDLKKSPSSKRSRSASLEDANNQEEIHPTKKLRAELESNFPTHDRILAEYIEKTSNNSIDDIQKHINQLIIEIQTLNDMIKAKEIEWNNMLHLKKVKEEICFRLTRKKQVMEIMSTKIGEIGTNITTTSDDTMNESISQNKYTKLLASTPNVSTAISNFNTTSILHNLSNTTTMANATNCNANTTSTSTSTTGSTAQSILQNRANMKSSDLAKEKANTQRLHRNILPKPSSTSLAAAFAVSSTVSIPLPTILSSTIATTAAAAASTTPITMTSSSAAAGVVGSLPLSFIGSLGGANAMGNQQPILNSYLTAAATVQQQLGEMLNGHHNSTLQQQNSNNGGQTLMVGRQGVFKDVKSIIADYRQRHPEVVPRRGRRVKSNPSATDSSILGNALKNEGKLNNDLGSLLKFDGNSRPSSNDSSHSMTNLIGGTSTTTGIGNMSFKDVLVQFAKMSGQTDRIGATNSAKLAGTTSTATGSGSQSAPPPYPEVTLHPVSTSQSNADQSGSLLHGILTKYTRPNTTSNVAVTSTTQTNTSQNYNSSFSPTLARLLTAPERITAAHNNQTTSNSYQTNLQAVQSAVAGTGLNLSKVVGHNSEITITPVVSTQPSQQTLLQQQLQQQLQHHQQQQQQLKEALNRDRVKGDGYLNLDDEADDSVDRLVIDEGGDSAGIDEHHRIAPHAIGQEFHENEVPVCQGCKKQEAQFVCAGCGNQWYCSRECQVAAWDEHSEVCTG